MAEQTVDALGRDGCEPCRQMSIHTQKITDSCRDKDCIEDLRVYLTAGSQQLLDTAANVRVRCAQLLNTGIDVEGVAFDRNHYCIDVTFYYRVLADAVVGACRPTTVYGLAVFSKRVVLCGEDSRVHIYRSDQCAEGLTPCQADRPTAVVEVLDPMVLSSRIRDGADASGETVAVQIPQVIRDQYDEELVLSGGQRRLYVTLGQFSLIRLERDTQLVIPVLEYSIPTKECCDAAGGCAEDPCEMFSRIPFPEGQFSPEGGPKEGCATCQGG